MALTALELIEFLETENSAIMIAQKSTCETLSMETCKEYFDAYKTTYDVIGSFDDDVWLIKNDATDLYVKFIFTNIFPSYKEKLKKYAIIKLYKQNTSIPYLKESLSYIYKTMLNVD